MNRFSDWRYLYFNRAVAVRVGKMFNASGEVNRGEDF